MNNKTEKAQAALARKTELIVKELPDEVLVYDLKRDKAHCLNLTAAFVWSHCDGKTSTHEIAELMSKEWQTPVSEDTVWFAINRLNKADLLEERITLPESKVGISRRSAVRRLAFGALMIPAVMSIVAPTASAGSSIPPECQACVKKGAGGIALCASTCAGFAGTCFGDSGCGTSRALQCSCITCGVCFTDGDPDPTCHGLTVSWVAPGPSC